MKKQTLASYEKLSKKAKKEINAKRRGSWYGLSPVSRMAPPPKAYRRSRIKRQAVQEW